MVYQASAWTRAFVSAVKCVPGYVLRQSFPTKVAKQPFRIMTAVWNAAPVASIVRWGR